MWKIKFLLFICFIILIGALKAQIKSGVYDFPVKPGTPEWRAIKTNEELNKRLQIPENILKSMNTQDLLITCMNYPRFGDIWSFQDYKYGFLQIRKLFNGLDELINRKDVLKELLKYLDGMDPSTYKNAKQDVKKFVTFEFVELEMIIAQDEIINNLSKEERISLIEKIYNKHEELSNVNELRRIRYVEPGIFIMGKILKIENKDGLQQKSSKNKNLDGFLNTTLMISPETISDILDLTKQLLSSHSFKFAKESYEIQNSYDVVYDFTTPRGTLTGTVYHYNSDQSPEDSLWYYNYYTNNYHIQVISGSTQKYNCFGKAFSDGLYKFNKDRAQKFLDPEKDGGDGSYDLFSSTESATHVMFSESHAATLDAINKDICYSKFGDGPYASHRIDMNPYPPGYGVAAGFYRRSVDVPEDCYGIEDALSNAAAGQTIEVRENSPYGYKHFEMELYCNATIPNGVTIKLLSAPLLNFKGNYIDVSQGGVLDIQNGATVYLKEQDGSKFYGLFTSIQEAVDHARPGQVIELHTSVFNESFSLIDKSEITIVGNGATINGDVNLINTSYCSIDGLNIPEGNSLFVNGGIGTMVNNVQADNSADVLSVYGSSSCFVSDFNANNGNDIGCNIINSFGGISSSSLQNHMVAIYIGGNGQFYANSTYFCSNEIDVDASALYPSSLTDNTYSRPVPQSLSGYYNLSGTQASCQNSILAKSAEGVNIISSKAPGELDNLFMDLMIKMGKDDLKNNISIKGKYGNDIKKIINTSKDELNKSKDKLSIKANLARLSSCYRMLDNKEEFSSLRNDLLSSLKEKNLSPYIKRYEIQDYVDNQDYNGAIKSADNILTLDGVDEDLTCELLFEKAVINKNYIKNYSDAYKLLSQIIEQYPKNHLTGFAKSEIKNMPKSVENPYITQNGNSDAKFSCSNYPNPFNPSTKFSFSLPKDAYTELKIYNSLGQELETLVSENMSKGQYSIEWNAGKYSSGIYFYTLKSNDQITTSKLIIIK